MRLRHPLTEAIRVYTLIAVSAALDQICVCTTLRRSARSIGRLYDLALKREDIRVTGYTILARLAARGPLAISELAAELTMDRTTCTREVAPLVTLGYIEVIAAKDRRRRLLRLTLTGITKHAKGRPAWAEAQARLATEFGGAELTDLLKSLDRLINITESLQQA